MSNQPNNQRLYPLSAWLVWVAILPGVLLATAVALVVTAERGVLLFDNPDLWWVAAAAPVGGLLFLYGVVRRRKALARFASERLAPLLTRNVHASKQALRSGLVVTAILLVSAALIGPRWGIYLEKQRIFGRDIVVALDVSRSMLATDVEPNRLDHAKQQIRQQLTERGTFQQSNRLALLAFAGSTSLRLPLTTDTLAFRSKLEGVHVGSAPRGGTAIGEAIRASVELFAKSPKEATKIILLFTDGEDHEGGPVDAAKEAWTKHGIKVYTIGVGDPARTVGAQVPIALGSKKPLLHEGQIVFSRLDVQGLRAIAQAGAGLFAGVSDLFGVVNHIATTKKAELSTQERMRHRPRYPWFVAAALLLLYLETLITELRPVQTDQPQRIWQQEGV